MSRVIAFVGVCLIASVVQGGVHTEYDQLTEACELTLDALYANYSSPQAVSPECDNACFVDCGDTIKKAIEPTKNSDCQRTSKISMCLRVS